MFPNVYNQFSSDTIKSSLEILLVKYFEIQCKLHEKSSITLISNLNIVQFH